MRYKLILIVIILISSCGDNNIIKKEPVNTLPPSVFTKDLRTERFDYLEKIFHNENWLMLDNKDSNYFYCSRLGKTYFKAYQYRMFNGDSIDTRITEITLSSDTITWVSLNNPTVIYLSNVTSGEAIWLDKTNLHLYTFNKADSMTIKLTYPDGTVKHLSKTHTLASFLIRSKYDYQHGTRLAFDKNR